MIQNIVFLGNIVVLHIVLSIKYTNLYYLNKNEEFKDKKCDL